MPLAETLSEYWRTLQCDLFPYTYFLSLSAQLW